MWDQLIPLLFPKDFRISKIFGHPTLGCGDKKKLLKLYLKSEQMDKQTHKQTDTWTDIFTYRKHRPRRPMLWKQYKILLSLVNRGSISHAWQTQYPRVTVLRLRLHFLLVICASFLGCVFTFFFDNLHVDVFFMHFHAFFLPYTPLTHLKVFLWHFYSY